MLLTSAECGGLAHQDLSRSRVTLDDFRAQHIADVLRADIGAAIQVGIENGARGTATLSSIERRGESVRCELECIWTESPTPKPPVDLVLALPRPKAFLRMLSPIAQLGVGHLFVTNAYKVEPSYFESHVLDPETMRKELRIGLMQSKTTYLPSITLHASFAWLMKTERQQHSDATRFLVAEPLGEDANSALFAELAREQNENPNLRTLLFVGPEGGFAPREIRILLEHGARSVSLGSKPYRSDLATYLLLDRLAQSR